MAPPTTTTSSHIPQHQKTSHNYASFNANYSKLKSIREVAESPNLLSNIPSNYAYFTNQPDDHSDDAHFDLADHHNHDSIPVIDFSLLQSGSSDERSKVIKELGDACRNWGFFMVVNHGVPETLMNSALEKCKELFNLTSEEKQEFEGKHVLDPIRCGTSFNPSVEHVNFWRDYLKVMVHPQFHSPSKPHGFSDVSWEYCKQVRHLARAILRGISASLGLDELEIERSMDLEMGQQMLIANYYPACPRPDLAIGMPPHSDHGLLTFLAQNQVDGLQILKDGKWLQVHALPNSFLVNTGDHIEIFSNGIYKSVVHRVMVNNTTTRISLAIANGPSLNDTISPASKLVEQNGCARYNAMAYREFMRLQQSNNLNGKSVLDVIRV